MTNTNSYFVESKGIELPDGSVFGRGTEEKFRVVSEYGQPGFLVYAVCGHGLVNMFGSGVRVNWRAMKEALDKEFKYQRSIGNKVLRCGQEITEI